MKSIVGLGNPGTRYQHTRHNVGFMTLDRLVERVKKARLPAEHDEWHKSTHGQCVYLWIRTSHGPVELAKPLTFMNQSGKTVAYIRKKHPELELDFLYVVHDDLDIPLGKFKIQQGKGPKVHNGLNSIYQTLGTEDFWHVRIGVDNRGTGSMEGKESLPAGRQVWGGRMTGEKYVLQPFRSDERPIIENVINQVVERLFEEVVK